MKDRVALLLLVAALVAAFVAPAASVAADCEEEGGGECCGLEGAVCLCCSPAPRTTLPPAGGRPAIGPAGSVGTEAAAAAPEPLPRDILHVPKPAPSH